jgi:hypothetical protein
MSSSHEFRQTHPPVFQGTLANFCEKITEYNEQVMDDTHDTYIDSDGIVMKRVAGRLAFPDGSFNQNADLSIEHSYSPKSQLFIIKQICTTNGNTYGYFEQNDDKVWILMTGKVTSTLITSEIRDVKSGESSACNITLSHD